MITSNTIIVSMTSWPPRIGAVPNAYNAVLRQIEPGMNVHCVLVLSTEEFPNKEKDLPQTVLDLGVEILWTERNTRSHKKLMPTLRKYPNNAIIVIDDDTCQVEGWLRTFIEDHAKNPNDIIFGQSTSVCHVGINGNIYEIRNGSCYETPGAIAYTQKPASGASGTLFPPHVFTRNEFYDEDLMMELSPTCDETWQWAFALMENRTIRALSRCNLPVINPCNQDCSLINTNRLTINRIHAAIAARFPEYKEELKRRQGSITVSVYSHDDRLATVHKTLESLLIQEVRPKKVLLLVPSGQKGLVSNEAKKLEAFGLVEIHELSNSFGRHNRYLVPLLAHQGNATILAADNCVYPSDFIRKLWVCYLQDPSNVYTAETKVIALAPDGSPLPYELWGTHGRLYEETAGYRDQTALVTGGVIIPPSSIGATFNQKALTDYLSCPDTLLHCGIVSSGLNVARLNIKVERHSGLPDEVDSAEAVNALINEYRVV